jgi:hypothetical protein
MVDAEEAGEDAAAADFVRRDGEAEELGGRPRFLAGEGKGVAAAAVDDDVRRYKGAAPLTGDCCAAVAAFAATKLDRARLSGEDARLREDEEETATLRERCLAGAEAGARRAILRGGGVTLRERLSLSLLLSLSLSLSSSSLLLSSLLLSSALLESDDLRLALRLFLLLLARLPAARCFFAVVFVFFFFFLEEEAELDEELRARLDPTTTAPPCDCFFFWPLPRSVARPCTV